MAGRNPLFYGWIIVGISMFYMILVYGVRHSFGVFFSPILSEFGWSRGNISIMLSLNILIYGFLSPIVGTLADRWKPRKLMIFGISVLSLSTAGCAFASKLWHFYVFFGLLMSIGMVASGWPMLLPTLMNWFHKRRGFVIGLGQVGGGLSFVYSIFVEFSILQWGWRNTFLILAASLVLLLPLQYLFFYYRPRDKNLEPYGGIKLNMEPEPIFQGKSIRKHRIAEMSLRDIIRAYPFWLLVIANTLFWGFGAYMVMAHQVRFAEDMGFSSMYSVSIFALCGTSLCLGQLSGFISDWLGREKTGTAGTILSIIAMLALLSIEDNAQPWLLYLFAICFGYGIGLFSPTLYASAADIFHGRHFGSVAGFLIAGMGFGGAIGPWTAGFLFDRYGSYSSAFILCIISFILACICLWIAAPRKAIKGPRKE
jgi:MFS family permease